MDRFFFNHRGTQGRFATTGMGLSYPVVAKRPCVPLWLKTTTIISTLLLILTACGGGSGDSDPVGSRGGGLSTADFNCSGDCPNRSLAATEVTQILRQAVTAAKSLGVSATISVVDRVGNVLAVYQMAGASPVTTISGQIGAVGGLENVAVPSTLAAISKAGTGAFLSSQGNAFSTRTASQIIQENFNPGEGNQPGGPLFGVQFSQLICSDIPLLNPELTGGLPLGGNPTAAGSVGPRPLPLGLSADSGGLPLYKFGDPVGGIGVELNGAYTLDRDISDFDDDIEERIALAGSIGFEAPSERVGDRIFVLGKSLRFADLDYTDLEPLPAELSPLDMSRLVAVPLFSTATIRNGVTFGSPSSGVARGNRLGIRSAFLTDGSGVPRFPPRKGTALPGGSELTAGEVSALIDSAFFTAFRTRAAIRTPRGSQAHVTIFIVDTAGEILGMVRTADAPVFGIDVALQKARTATFFSSADAGERLNGVRIRNQIGAFKDYVTAVRQFLGPTALTGTHAFSDRSGGNLSRPFFPDGVGARGNGPFSLPFPGKVSGVRTWSPFNTGLQLDLIFQRLVQPLGVPINPPPAIPESCTDSGVLGSRLRNGIQIFPGSVPLYRGRTLIGGIGISGDGIDQDDLIAFFGASRKGLDEVGHVNIGDPVFGFNAPPEIRADLIEGPEPNTRLRYVNCPETPFRDSSEQQVCGGL